jgi:hypothetical protein
MLRRKSLSDATKSTVVPIRNSERPCETCEKVYVLTPVLDENEF